MTKTAVCDILNPIKNERAEIGLKKERGGIIIAGNILTDRVKVIDAYPDRNMLANIVSVSVAVGGCVPNTAIDLAKIDGSLPVGAAGRTGDDEGGRYLISELQKNGINTEYIKISETEKTSFSDVMSEAGTGERTFYH